MLSYTFSDLSISIFVSGFLLNIWNIYYVYTNSITTPNVQAIDLKIKKHSNILDLPYFVVFNLFLVWFSFLNYTYLQNFTTQHLLWGSVYISNTNISYLYFLIITLLLILLCGLYVYRANIPFSIEYLIFICLVILSGYLLLSSTNLLIAIFLLELVALFIFGKFTVTRLLTTTNKAVTEKTVSLYMNHFSFGLFNSLFFQFWANFVSSICLFFALINVHYLFGTSNFYMINFFLSILTSTWYSPEFFSSVTFIILITGLFVKLGLAPYQFFKIETYKGVPLFSVITYTTLYLTIYIIFFVYLYTYQLFMIREFVGTYMIFFVLLSTLYVTSLLFDTKNFKAFLSYSTLVTVTNIFLVVLTI